MLNYSLVNSKPLIKVNDVSYKDLLAKTFNSSKEYFAQVVIVNEYYVGRPDLISLAMYGDDRYADVICKINGISNPFELNENDILFLPDIEFIRNCCKQSSSKSEIVETEDEILTLFI